MKKRSRSGGVRNPARNAILFAVLTFAGLIFVVMGWADMRESGRSGSPWLALGLFPALLGPIFLIYYWTRIGAFRDMQEGRTALARWTVPAEQFDRFRQEEERVPAGSVLVNYYRPPRDTPAEGVEVIFSDRAVLIGDGYFPLSTTGGRRVGSVRYVPTDPPSLEFGMVLVSGAQTSSATIGMVRTAHTLRVPVALDARNQAGAVVNAYQAHIDRR
jgi:hypothetical protein